MSDIEWPAIGDYNWGEKLLAGLTLLGQQNQLSTVEVLRANPVIADLHTVVMLTGQRDSLTTLAFEDNTRLRVLINQTGATVKLGEEQIGIGETAMMLPLGEGAYKKLSLGQPVCEQVEFPIKTMNGVTAEWRDGELCLGINYDNLTATDIDRIRNRITE